MSLPSQLEALAVDIAREAGELAQRRRTEGVAIAATKSSIADIVTEADREVEDLIRRRLAAERPGDGFLGEESDAERGTTGITWVVDPIDGTVNYAYGIPAYAVSIAAVREILGTGSLFGVHVMPAAWPDWVIMVLPPGAFLTYGLLLGCVNWYTARNGGNNAA